MRTEVGRVGERQAEGLGAIVGVTHRKTPSLQQEGHEITIGSVILGEENLRAHGW